MGNARRFTPTFTATVVPEAVDHLEGRKGPYALMSGAVIVRDGKPDVIRTVMAFGPAYGRVGHLLRPGMPIRLDVRHDGGSMRIVGLPEQPDPLSLLTGHVEGTSYAETVAATLAVLLSAFGVRKDAIPTIVETMIAGGSEDDADVAVDPDEDEAFGSLLRPLIAAEVGRTTALSIIDAIVSLPIACWLDDMAEMRRQDVARSFLLAAE